MFKIKLQALEPLSTYLNRKITDTTKLLVKA